MRAAVLTVSDGVHHGTREDRSGDALAELLEGEGFEVERRIVPDEADEIAAAIVELAETSCARADNRRHRVHAPRRHARGDARVLDREAPGIAEAIRADALTRTPHALLSRGLAGLRGVDADRQPAGLAGRLPGRLRGAPAGARHTALELAAGDQSSRHAQT